MSNTLSTPVEIDDNIINVIGEEELLPWAKAQQPYFQVTNTNGLNWEGHAASKEELEARFPTATVTEWAPTEFAGIWELGQNNQEGIRNPASTTLTIDFLRENIGKEFIYHLRNGKKEILIIDEFLVEVFQENGNRLNTLTPNF